MIEIGIAYTKKSTTLSPCCSAECYLVQRVGKATSLPARPEICREHHLQQLDRRRPTDSATTIRIRRPASPAATNTIRVQRYSSTQKQRQTVHNDALAAFCGTGEQANKQLFSISRDALALPNWLLLANGLECSVIFVTKIKTRTRIIGLRFKKTRTKITMLQKT